MRNRPRGIQKPLNHTPDGLRYALNQSGYKQRQLAAQLDRAESVVSEWLRGTRNMSTKDIELAADFLNCPRVVIEAKYVEEASA